MEFRFKTNVILSKEFVVEAANPGEAMNNIRTQLAENPDFSSFELIKTEFDITDPSVREYNHIECKKIIDEYKKNNTTQQ